MTATVPVAFPLQWPVGWKRAAQPKHSRYRIKSFAQVREGIFASIRLMKGTHPVLSSNVELRRDGLPYATFKEPSDRGVAVYWTAADRHPMVMACDTWETVVDNAHAIELALEALRQLERTGASQILERAFTGFTALPASTRRPWREVLGCNGAPLTPALVEAYYRTRAKVLHPDMTTGSHAAMLELNAARTEALAELGV